MVTEESKKLTIEGLLDKFFKVYGQSSIYSFVVYKPNLVGINHKLESGKQDQIILDDLETIDNFLNQYVEQQIYHSFKELNEFRRRELYKKLGGLL